VLESASSVSGVKQAVDGWSQAQQEMHKKQELPHAQQ